MTARIKRTTTAVTGSNSSTPGISTPGASTPGVPWDTVDDNFNPDEQFYTGAGYGGGEVVKFRVSIPDMQIIRTIVQSEKFDKLRELGDIMRHYIHVGNQAMITRLDDPKWVERMQKHDQALRQMRAMQKAADEETALAVFGETLKSIQRMVDESRRHGDDKRALEMIRVQWRFIEGMTTDYWRNIWREKFKQMWPEFKP